jgi:tight adherence protein B
MTIALLTFAITTALVVGLAWVFVFLPESKEQSTLRTRLRAEGRLAGGNAAVVALARQREPLSTIPLLDSALASISFISDPLKLRLDQANLKFTVGTFLLVTVGVTFGAALLVLLYVPIWWLALAVAVLASLLPWTALNIFRTRRIHKFEEQFPEAIDLIGRALRAGHAFTTGIKIAADELPPPAGPEFKLLYERQNFGAQMPDALRSFANRIPSLDARFFVTAVLTQRETGGNLAEVLDRLAAVMRERFRIKREVRVKSAHGRITAYVLAGMPPALAVLMFFNSPEQLKLLLTDPMGIRMIMVAVGLQIVGTLIVRRLVNIQY